MSNKSIKTDFLFAQPSFISGLARTLDIAGTFDTYNRSVDEATADYRAVCNDWKMVGQDMKNVISEPEKAA